MAVDQLEEFPLIGRAVPEAKAVALRELIVHPYRVMYRVKRSRREIVAIVHAARDVRAVKPRPWRR